MRNLRGPDGPVAQGRLRLQDAGVPPGIRDVPAVRQAGPQVQQGREAQPARGLRRGHDL